MIKAYFQAFCAFWKSVFSDGGTGSFSRCGAGAVLGCTLAWVSYLVIKNGALPDLAGPAWFIASGVGICYGTNRASDIIAAYKSK